MNEAELAGLTAELPERFAGRVSDSSLRNLQSYADAGEWDELLDLLVAALKSTGAHLSRKELEELRRIFTEWRLPTDELAGLNVAD